MKGAMGNKVKMSVLAVILLSIVVLGAGITFGGTYAYAEEQTYVSSPALEIL